MKSPLLYAGMALIFFSMNAMANTGVYSGTDEHGNTVFSDRTAHSTSKMKKLNSDTVASNSQPQKAVHQEQQKTHEQKKQFNHVIEQREQLNQNVKEAYAEIDAIKSVLNNAKERQQTLLKKCGDQAGAQRANGKNSVIVCKPESLAPIEVELAKTKAKLERLLTELDSLPR